MFLQLHVSLTSKSNVLELVFLRFVNIFHYTNVDTFWKAVKKVKFNATLNKACGKDGLYSDKLILVKRVEKELQMNSSEVSFENMTAKNLKTAAD